ncbi:MAG: hypothetical protein QM604_00085, partial [Microbacterium sp.]
MFDTITTGSAFRRPRRQCRRALALVAAAAAVGGSFAFVPLAAQADDDTVLTVAAGETYTISETAAYDEVVIEDGASLVAASGYSVTLTVDGVETGQAYASIDDVDGTLQAGDYVSTGDDGVVLTVTTLHAVTGSSLT